MIGCVSDLSLERYLVDELDTAEELAHVTACVHCQTALAAKRTAGATYMASPAARRLAQLVAVTEPIAPRRRARNVIGIATVAFAFAIALALFAWPRATATDRDAEVLAVEHAWMTAYLHDDDKALDEILANDYRFTDASGRITTKTDELATARSHRVHYDAYDTTDLSVHVWGDTAVVTGRSKLRGNAAGKPFTRDLTFTDTLARIDGRWHAVAAHVSHTAN